MKIELSATNTQKNAYIKNNLYVSMLEVEPYEGAWHFELHEILGHLKSESGCPCQETKAESSLDIPVGRWSKTYVQINTKINWTQNQASAMAISVSWPKLVGWVEDESAQERTLDDLERLCKEEWSPIPFSVFYPTRCYGGEDSMLFYWQRLYNKWQ